MRQVCSRFRRLLNRSSSLLHCERGQTLAEYALIISVIVGIGIAALSMVATDLRSVFDQVTRGLTGATTTTATTPTTPSMITMMPTTSTTTTTVTNTTQTSHRKHRKARKG